MGDDDRFANERLISGFRNPDTATPPWSQSATLAWPEFQVPVATRFEQDCCVCSRNVGPFWKPEASDKPCGVTEDRSDLHTAALV